jgi:hypothetical protein
MTLQFPSSPSNNDVYENYIYNSTAGAWQKLPGNTFADAAISDTPPVNPNNGDLWWNSADGQFYVYYNDGSSAQWVSASMPSVAVSDTPPAGYEGQLWLDSTDGSMYVYYTDPGGASSSWIGAVSRSGGILQVVSTTKTDTFSESVATGTLSADVPGLTVTITPSSVNSKLLVMYHASVGSSTNLHNVVLYRDGSPSRFIGDSATSKRRSTSEIRVADTFGATSQGVMFLDNANSTSSTTYSIRLGHDAGSTQTMYLNRSGSDTLARTASSITVMEVAG